MNESTKTKKALRGSLFALFLCIVLLIGTTFAWFTDTASTGVNKIQAGNLKVDIVDATNTAKSLKGDTLKFTDVNNSTDILWEPGVTFNTPAFKIKNAGNLALKYKLTLNGVTGDQELLDAITFSVVDENENKVNLDNFEGNLAKEGMSGALYIQGHMDEAAGNECQGKSLESLSLTVVATQDTVENDSFNNLYDKDATVNTSDAAEINDAMKKAGSVVNINNDVTVGNTLVADKKDITLNMNGKTIKNTKDIWSDNEWSLVSAQKGSSMTIDGNGTFNAKENDCYAVDVRDGSTVTIKNGTFVGNIHAVYVLEGTAIIEGGTYSVQQKYPVASKADEFVLNCYDANRANGTAKIIVKGGTFINFNPADCQAEGAHTNFVAPGYTVKSEKKGSDTYYTVVKAN